jgi:hypothetical protein
MRLCAAPVLRGPDDSSAMGGWDRFASAGSMKPGRRALIPTAAGFFRWDAITRGPTTWSLIVLAFRFDPLQKSNLRSAKADGRGDTDQSSCCTLQDDGARQLQETAIHRATCPGSTTSFA